MRFGEAPGPQPPEVAAARALSSTLTVQPVGPRKRERPRGYPSSAGEALRPAEPMTLPLRPDGRPERPTAEGYRVYQRRSPDRNVVVCSGFVMRQSKEQSMSARRDGSTARAE